MLFAVGIIPIPVLTLYFLLSGLYTGMVDPLEALLAGDYLPAAVRGRGFGLLGAAHGDYDLIASAGVGCYTLSRQPVELSA